MSPRGVGPSGLAAGHRARRHSFHLTLLARTGEGVRNLLRLSSLSFLEGFYYKPRIDKEILAAARRGPDLPVGLRRRPSSPTTSSMASGAEAEALCAWYQKVFGAENFYVEIQDNGVQIQRDHAQEAIDLARRLGLPLVAHQRRPLPGPRGCPGARHPALHQHRDDRRRPGRLKFETDQFHVRSPEEMYEALAGQEEALATSAAIAERVEENYESLDLGKRQFPSFQPPDRKTPEDYLRELCEQGVRDRYGADPPPGGERAARARARRSSAGWGSPPIS